MRLFRSPVFTVCCVLSFIVGFAMLGALTFLPTFMQFVDGVSATEVGPADAADGGRTADHVDGQRRDREPHRPVQDFPGRRHRRDGRGFVLLSRMDAATPMLLQSLYLFVLGTGIGMCMQVLILIVQNTVDFEDLGVATSGVTFFRTIGSSFGAAIFGSLFTNFLDDRIGPALAASGAPPAAAESPQALHQLTPEMAAPIVNAYADSLGLVFLCAAPVALVGFFVALLLKEVPLREMEDRRRRPRRGFGMPSTESPDKVLEIAIGRLMRHSPEIRLRNIAGRPGCELDVARLWALLQIYRHNQAFGSARLTRDRRAAAGAARGTRTDLRSPGGFRLRAAHRRPALAHPGRRPAGRRRLLSVGRADRRQAGPLTNIRGASGPRPGGGRPRTHHAPDTGSARLGRRPP